MDKRIKHKPEIDERFFKIKTIYPTQYIELPNDEVLGYREAGQDNKIVLILIHGNFQTSI